MALRIRLAAMSGRAMNAACDPPLTDSMLAFIRMAMNRSQSGRMALSCPQTIYQAGRSFQPAMVATHCQETVRQPQVEYSGGTGS